MFQAETALRYPITTNNGTDFSVGAVNGEYRTTIYLPQKAGGRSQGRPLPLLVPEKQSLRRSHPKEPGQQRRQFQDRSHARRVIAGYLLRHRTRIGIASLGLLRAFLVQITRKASYSSIGDAGNCS